MQSSPRAVAVGVDLGSSTTTVSTRRIDRRSGEAERGRPPDSRGSTRSPASSDAGPADADEPVLVALAVPATWRATRRRAHAEAAANAGFDAGLLVSEPEAAARWFTEAQGRQADTGTIVVCNLGAGSCRAGVVRRDGDCYTVAGAASAEDIGGREFDRCLLEHLANRHRHAAPEFWCRAGDPAETALRDDLLDAVRRAREHLTDHPSTAVDLPGLDRTLRLTREDADQCLTPAILRAVGLVEDAMRDADVQEDEAVDLLLVGGAGRTPLAATVLGHHLGLAPVVPDLPDLVIAEGAALAGLARIRDAREEVAAEPPSPRLRASPDVLVTAMVLVIVVAAVTGAVLLNRTPADDDDAVDSITASIPDSPEATSAALADPEPSKAERTEPVASEAAGTAADPGPEPEPAPAPTPADTSADTGADASPTAAPSLEAARTVPDVTGESVADARRILAEAGFDNVTAQAHRRDTEGPGVEHCEVTVQSPEGGSVGAQDDEILVHYVFVGTDTC